MCQGNRYERGHNSLTLTLNITIDFMVTRPLLQVSLPLKTCISEGVKPPLLVLGR